MAVFLFLIMMCTESEFGSAVEFTYNNTGPECGSTRSQLLGRSLCLAKSSAFAVRDCLRLQCGHRNASLMSVAIFRR
ncbi:MAG: hypothetical protein KGZ80_11970, partial [Methylomonas sp.]|nr:hypothetical protein [Methylomonas sp.]